MTNEAISIIIKITRQIDIALTKPFRVVVWYPSPTARSDLPSLNLERSVSVTQTV